MIRIQKVIKIGGSLLSSGIDYLNVAEKIKRNFLSNETKALLVVSAAKGITDKLISLAKGNTSALYEVEEQYMDIAHEIGDKEVEAEVAALIKELRTKITDCRGSDKCVHVISSYGERISAALMAGAFKAIGESSASISALKSVIAIWRQGDFSIDYESTSKFLHRELSKNNSKSSVFIVEGFIASLIDGEVVTLGRGGSDYTATALAAVLSLDETYFITETEGILSGDPKIVKRPKRIDILDLNEARIASQLGVKKLHPKTFEPVLIFSHPKQIYISSIDGVGTRICGEIDCSREGVKVVVLRDIIEEPYIAVIGKGGPREVLSMVNEESFISHFIKRVEEVNPYLFFARIDKSFVYPDFLNYLHDRLVWGEVSHGQV
ncbi:MAG TPA: aspartate kinase [Fervidicoccus fontis]|uniref:Aspartate kinase n=1 Tax=Fervidicoccus fontis TaxID=683846 RepID=A0A7C2YTJ4_9CREN|nr:aspartate kinase [Fervidicoccus fontis]